MNMQAKECRKCGFRTISAYDDTCAWCGHRDRWAQSPLAWAIIAPVVLVALIIWRKL